MDSVSGMFVSISSEELVVISFDKSLTVGSFVPSVSPSVSKLVLYGTVVVSPVNELLEDIVDLMGDVDVLLWETLVLPGAIVVEFVTGGVVVLCCGCKVPPCVSGGLGLMCDPG